MELKTSFKYPDWAKMPKNYDFSTKQKDWSQYWTDFLLRTDAVWEKSKLYEYFRLYYKTFEFNKEESQYYLYYPRESFLAFWYPHHQDELNVQFNGYTPTGMTTAFKLYGAKNTSTDSSTMSGFGREDTYEQCAYRFDIWYQCDQFFSNDKAKYAHDNKEYPCYKIFYEMQYACSDHMLDYLIELAQYRKTNNTNRDSLLNSDLQTFPSIYDGKDQANRIKKTY